LRHKSGLFKDNKLCLVEISWNCFISKSSKFDVIKTLKQRCFIWLSKENSKILRIFQPMEVSFTTKEESNKKEEQRFLALSPSERLMEFLESMPYFAQFPSKIEDDKSDNFVIVLNQEKDGRMEQ
jgi:hypothetical protein